MPVKCVEVSYISPQYKVIPKPVAESRSTDIAGDGAKGDDGNVSGEEGDDGTRSDGGSEEE